MASANRIPRLFCFVMKPIRWWGRRAGGHGDAVNLLKPMLARGALRMIAATTWSEYKQFIEPDAALTRRFQRVLIGEPNESTAVDMLRAIAPHFAQHHNVTIRDGAIHAAVRLSLRNLPSGSCPIKPSVCSTPLARGSRSANMPNHRRLNSYRPNWMCSKPSINIWYGRSNWAKRLINS